MSLPPPSSHRAAAHRPSVTRVRGALAFAALWLAGPLLAEPFEIEDMPPEFDGVAHPWTEARRPVAVDFDGDGQTSWYAGGLRVAHPKAQTPLDPLRYSTAALPTITLPVCPSCTVRPVAFAVSDVNRDGRPDIVRLNEWNGQSFDYTLQVFINNDNGGFTLGYRTDFTDNPAFNEGVHYYQWVLADFDRDGDPDLAQLATYQFTDSTPNPNVERGNLRIIWNDNVGNFDTQTVLQSTQLSDDANLHVGDIERDGDIDLVVTGGLIWNTDGNISSTYNRSFLNAGDGTFTVATSQPSNTSLALSDVDRNGQLDYVYFSGSGIERSEAEANGTFLGGPTYATGVLGRAPLALAIADFDETGTPDLVTAEGANNSLSRNLTLRRGQPDGSAGEPELIATLPSNILHIGLGDARGDADNDLLLRLADGSFRLLRNTAQRLNAASTGIVFGVSLSGLTRVETADSNRDGIEDLFLLRPNSNQVHRAHGNTIGSFAPSEFKLLAGPAPDFAVGDFTRDGRTDFAYVTPGDGEVRTVTQNDNIYVAWPDTKIADYPGAAFIRGANVLNNNASLDLFVASNTTGGLRGFRNANNGTTWTMTTPRDSHPVMPTGLAVVPLYVGFSDAVFACNTDGLSFAINGYSTLLGWFRSARLVQVQDSPQTGVCSSVNLDTDSELELVFVAGFGALVSWSPQDSEISVTQTIDPDPQGLVRSIKPVDWNRDGLEDLLVGTSEGLFLYTREGPSDAWVRRPLHGNSPVEVRDAVAIDANRDSRPDVVYLTANGYSQVNNGSRISDTVSDATPAGTPSFIAPGQSGSAFSLGVANPGRFDEDARIAVTRGRVTFLQAVQNGNSFTPGAAMTPSQVQQAVASVTLQMDGLIIGTQGTGAVQADGSLEIPYNSVLGNLVGIPAGTTKDLVIRVNLSANAGSASYSNFFVRHQFSNNGVRVLHGNEPIGLSDSLARFAQNRIRIGTPQRGSLVFSAASVSVGEASGNASLTVRRIGGSDGSASVQVSTSNGTATAGADYTNTSLTLSWADGDAADKTVQIPVSNDSIDEPDETFAVSLSAPAGGAMLGTPSSATVTVVDNDLPPPAGALQFSASSYSVNEAADNASITLRRVNGTAGAVSVQVATSNGSATAGADYTATTVTVNWANGDSADKTVQIPVLNDSTDEPDETVSLSLSNFAGGATVGNPNAAMLTLVDDDAAAPGGDTIFASGFEGM